MEPIQKKKNYQLRSIRGEGSDTNKEKQFPRAFKRHVFSVLYASNLFVRRKKANNIGVRPELLPPVFVTEENFHFLTQIRNARSAN